MNIGFIGVGNMGAAMANSLMQAGHALTINDIRRIAAEPLLARGANWADTPREIGARSEIVFASLPKPADVEKVLTASDGLLASFPAGNVFFDLTTSEPLTSRRLAEVCAEKGVQFLDAPVSGGKRGAENRTLAIMVGGNRAAFDRYRPILEQIGSNVFYMGGVGNGNVTKLVNNMIAFCNRAAAVEGLLLGVKAGVEVGALADCIQASSGHSFSIDNLKHSVFLRNFAPAFTLDLASKDMQLAVEMARVLQVPLSLAPIVQQLMIEGLGKGWADQASTMLVTLQEQAAGVELRTP